MDVPGAGGGLRRPEDDTSVMHLMEGALDVDAPGHFIDIATAQSEYLPAPQSSPGGQCDRHSEPFGHAISELLDF